MGRLRALWWRIAGGLWFVPSVIVLASVLLAMVLVDIGGHHDVKLAELFPRIFGAAAEGSRGMLSAIAGSMITVAGVVFSVTIVALSLAASQYSPRVLRTFMADRPTQIVLGMFVGIFAYCLTVLRTIRGGEESYVPSIAVLGGMVLAFAGIGLLVYFIHHLATSIDASSILARVTAATRKSIDELFPEDLGAPLDEGAGDTAKAQAGPWTPVLACASGYIVSVDDDGLLAFARERGRILRMESGIGEFVIEGQPLASLHGTNAVDAGDEKALNACYALDTQRTIEQDAEFGLQQIIDVGAKALSPGINDSTTALMCIDRLAEIMVCVARRRIETPYRRDNGRLLVIAAGPSFARLLALAFEEMREEARGKRVVLARLLWGLEQIAAATTDAHRRRVIAEQAGKLAQAAHEGDRETAARARRLERRLAPGHESRAVLEHA